MRRRKEIHVSAISVSFCLIILVLSIGVSIGDASLNDIDSEIEQFKEKMRNTPDNCWKKPACKRKNAIIRKLTVVQKLIGDENYERAYKKFHYDIKPKLTGLITDENEEPRDNDIWRKCWGRYGFKNYWNKFRCRRFWGKWAFRFCWVTCADLREELRIDCNTILSHIKAETSYDDDTTGPVISVNYFGSGTDYDPGWWSVYIEDLESGLDEVQILINGAEYVYLQQLNGPQSISYDQVFIPIAVATYELTVIAKNNDNDYAGDQEVSTYTETVEINDDDITSPTISISYYGEGHQGDPGVWAVVVEDLESGIDEVQISIDEVVYIHNQSLDGIQIMSYPDIPISLETGTVSVGFHTIDVFAINNDKDWPDDQESSSSHTTVEIVPGPGDGDIPPILG